MNNTSTKHSNVSQDGTHTIKDLSQMSVADREVFLEKAGALVIQSAVLKFVVALATEEQRAFESWLESCAEDPDLIEKAVTTYPLFAEILTEEIVAFQSETERLWESV